MDPLLVVIGAVTAFVLLMVVLSRQPRRGRAPGAEPQRGPDYEAMADVEEHDIDDMLDAIDERRRRRGGRDVGEEVADELMRGTWEDRDS